MGLFDYFGIAIDVIAIAILIIAIVNLIRGEKQRNEHRILIEKLNAAMQQKLKDESAYINLTRSLEERIDEVEKNILDKIDKK